MQRRWVNRDYASRDRTRDRDALQRLGAELQHRFEGMTLDLEGAMELVSGWVVPVTFPATCPNPNRFVVPLARRGLHLEATLPPPYTGYRYVLRVATLSNVRWTWALLWGVVLGTLGGCVLLFLCPLYIVANRSIHL
jgi:hypothetical protein